MVQMPPSWQLGINSLSARRGRTALLIAAVALASSLVVAISTCVESVQRSMEQQLLETLGAADARIIHLFQGRFDASLLVEVRSWPEVKDAVGRFSSAITLVRADERADPETGLPLRVTPQAHGIDPEGESRIRPIELSHGDWPRNTDEIIVDSFIADRLEVEVGERLKVQRFGEPIILTVVGRYERPILGTLQRPQVQMLLPALEEATERRGSLSDIAISLHKGVDVDAFCSTHIDALPEQLSLEPAELARTGFDSRIGATRLMFTLASLFGFLACAQIIVIGMTTGVTERQRELAIVRCIGGTRAQVFVSQLCVGAIIGVLGAIIGAPLGLGLAAILLWYFGELVPGGVAWQWQDLLFAGAGSVAAGLVGALWPALVASRISPLRALAARAQPLRMRAIVVIAVIALAAVASQFLTFLIADGNTRFWWQVLAGQPAMQIGYFLLAVPVFVLLALLLARPLSAIFRLPPDLLKQAAMSVPIRLGLTAGALMIGIAFLVSSQTSTRAIVNDWLGNMTFADGFVFQRNGISPEERAVIESQSFVTDTCPIGYLPLRVYNQQIFGVEGIAPANVTCIGFDPEAFFKVNRVQWIAGTPEDAIPRLREGNAVLVAKEFLTAKGLSVGDTLRLGAGRVQHDYTIAGVIEAAGLDVATQLFGIRNAYAEHAIRCVFADFDVMAERFDNPDIYILQVNLSKSVTDEEARAQLARVTPGVLFVSGRSIKESISTMGFAFFLVQGTVAFAALLLASIAVGNVLMANAASRQFEYGILRALGATRGHLIRLILAEATLLGLTAAVIGTLFGLQTAFSDITFFRILAGMELRFRVPVFVTLIGISVLLVLTLAAAIPAITRFVRKTPRELFAVGRGGA